MVDADEAAERGGADADGERDARAVDDAAEHVAAHEVGAQHSARRRARASETRGVGRERVERGDAVGEERGQRRTAIMMTAPMAPSG